MTCTLTESLCASEVLLRPVDVILTTGGPSGLVDEL